MPHAVLVFGTFDILHPGHVWFLKHAASFGPVTVSLTPDDLCRRYKGALPRHPFAVRRTRLLRLRYVQAVVAADSEPYSFHTIATVAPERIILGYDQTALVEPIRRSLAQRDRRVRLLTLGRYHPELYRSSRLRHEETLARHRYGRDLAVHRVTAPPL